MKPTDSFQNLAVSILAFVFVPRSPHHTNRLFGGLIPILGWLTEREADVFVARIVRRDPNKGQASTLEISLKDMLVSYKTVRDQILGLD